MERVKKPRPPTALVKLQQQFEETRQERNKLPIEVIDWLPIYLSGIKVIAAPTLISKVQLFNFSSSKVVCRK